MSRIRSIKPEAFTDEKLWDAEQECGLPIFRAFTGLWTQADREGRFEWRPRALKAVILPYWDGDFAAVLDALERHGFLVSYEVDGRRYGYVLNFRKHQFVNTRESKSKLPEPPLVTHVRAHAETSAGPVESENPQDSDVLTEDEEDTCTHVQGADAPFPTPSPSLPDPRGGAGGDPDRETIVPQDLRARAERVSIPEQFADRYRVPVEVVGAWVDEIRDYWTIGGGAGQRRRHWLKTVRVRLHELGKAGKLGEWPEGKAPPSHQRDNSAALAALERANALAAAKAKAAAAEPTTAPQGPLAGMVARLTGGAPA